MNNFQHQLDEWRDWAEVSFAAASVRRNGSLVWSGLSLESNMGTATHDVLSPYRFPIYSITKTFTAVCLFRLQSKGLLHLDDPLHKWKPDLPIPSDVRLSHLLQHTSGLPDYGPLRDT